MLHPLDLLMRITPGFPVVMSPLASIKKLVCDDAEVVRQVPVDYVAHDDERRARASFG